MKILVDQQLPPLLAEWLRSKGIDARHVREVGRRDASDVEIWNYAIMESAVVVSRDVDFVRLWADVGGARVVWVRIGNCDNATLIARFESSWQAVHERLDRGDGLVEFR